jgi:hypothetical protein
VNSPDDLPSLQRAARRKLVRGVFAAPAVLTVCNASATAISSSMRCINNQVTGVSTVKTQPVSNALDAWLRVQLWSTGSGASMVYYVSGADVHAYKRADKSSYIGSTQWQQFNITTNTGATTFVGGMPTGAIRASKYASVRFDANGNITGVGTGAVGTAAMPGTCWTSFHTAP